MKTSTMFAALAAAAMFTLPACSKEEAKSTSKAASDATKAAKDAAADATKAAGDAFVKLRDDAAAALTRTMDGATQKYNDLKAQVAKLGDTPAAAELRKSVDAIKARMDGVTRQLGDLKTAGADQWQSIKDATSKAMDEMNQMLTSALEKAKAAVTPAPAAPPPAAPPPPSMNK